MNGWLPLLKEYGSNGFSVLVAFLLLGAILGFIPSPFARDTQKEHTALVQQGQEMTKLLRIICYAQTKSAECLR